LPEQLEALAGVAHRPASAAVGDGAFASTLDAASLSSGGASGEAGDPEHPAPTSGGKAASAAAMGTTRDSFTTADYGTRPHSR
jgi:hypothetical protein